MKGQVVLITGALAGIGRATALAFAREGASLVVSGRRDEEGRKLQAELRGLGVEAEYVRADVRREDDVRALFGIPATVAVASLVVLGHPADPPRRLKRAPVSSFAWVDRYQGTPVTDP